LKKKKRKAFRKKRSNLRSWNFENILLKCFFCFRLFKTSTSIATPVLSVTSKHLIEEILTDIESIKISPSSSTHTLNESFMKLTNGIRKRPVEKPTAEILQKM
jgi:hypothetical protein